MAPEPVPGTEEDAVLARVVALLVDSVFQMVLAIAVGVGGALALGSRAVIYVLVPVAMVLYFFAFEALFAQTPGKRLMGIMVVDVRDDSPPSTAAAFYRNLLRPVDAIASYALGLLVMILNDYQRIGDLVAGTTVVETKPSTDPAGAADRRNRGRRTRR